MKTNTLGSYIRFLRSKNHLTQSQLADKLYITDKAVSKWERDLSYPDIKLFPKLADALGVSLNDLLKEGMGEAEATGLVRLFERSHDFRTPLHIILGCADLAENHYENKEMVLRYLQNIRASGEYLLEWIEKAARTARRDPARSPDPRFLTEDLDEYLKEGKRERKESVAPCRFSGKRILIAEDMEINREIIGELLRRYGAEIEFAQDGRICLDKVIANPAGTFDLILMDVSMPNMDGMEATRRIRRLSDPGKAAIPIVAVTANSSEKDRSAAIEAGMNDFTEKPISMEKLFEVIKQQLSG